MGRLPARGGAQGNFFCARTYLGGISCPEPVELRHPPQHLDVLSVDGRDGGGVVPSYDTLMRIGTAARNGGDLANAVGVFRRASEVDPLNPAPLVAAGDVLLEIGSVNEAIVAYNNALLRGGENLPALLGLARAYLKTGKPALAMEPLSKATR
jgi:tetratricopeptide (TPR) repeat protein